MNLTKTEHCIKSARPFGGSKRAFFFVLLDFIVLPYVKDRK